MANFKGSWKVDHLALNFSVKIGMAIGTAIMPGVGTVIGFLGGVAIGIIANSAIDMIYDNTVGEFVTKLQII
jgi:hypothetical protein